MTELGVAATATPDTTESVEEFLARVAPQIERFLIKAGCRLAEDLTWDGCRIMWQKWDELRSDPAYAGTDLRSYFFTVARNSFFRHNPKDGEWLRQLGDTDTLDFDELPIDLNSPDSEVADRVHRTLLRMEVHHRQVLWLRHAEEFSTTETAQIMKAPEGTIKYWLHQAIKHFQTLYESHDLDHEGTVREATL